MNRARGAVVLAIVAIVAAITLQAVSATAPISSNPSAATFTVAPTSGLGDETIIYTVSAPSGLFGLKAHLCEWTTSAYTESTFNIGTGTKCVNGATIYEGGLGGMTANDYETITPFSGSETTSGALSFKVGTGNVKFTSDSGQLGLGGAGLTCDATTSCALVVRADVNGFGTPIFLSQQLCFGADGTCTSGPTTTTTPPTTTPPTTTPPTTTPPTTTPPTTTPPTTTPPTTVPSTTTTTAPPTDSLTPSSVAPGGSVNISSDGWKPNSVVTATLNSTPVILGTMDATAAGLVKGQFTIPTTTEVGSHTIVLGGFDPDDNLLVEALPLTVTAAVPVPADTTVTTSGFATTAGATTTGVASTGSLPFSGSNTRDLATVGLLLLAAGMLLLGQHYRHRSAT
jgi:hypothetical protein